MAIQNPLTILGMQMHRSAKAILKHLAISTLTRFHPLTVAERLETVFPNVQKIIFVDIALHKATVDVGASGNGTINQDGTYGDTSAAEIEPVANLALVRTDVCLATEFAIYLAYLSGRDDEIHELTKLHIAELQALVSGSATNRVDGTFQEY